MYSPRFDSAACNAKKSAYSDGDSWIVEQPEHVSSYFAVKSSTVQSHPLEIAVFRHSFRTIRRDHKLFCDNEIIEERLSR